MDDDRQEFCVAVLQGNLHEQHRVESERHEVSISSCRDGGQIGGPVERPRVCLEHVRESASRIRVTNHAGMVLKILGQSLQPGEHTEAQLPVEICWQGGCCIAFDPICESAIARPEAGTEDARRILRISGRADSTLDQLARDFSTVQRSPSPETLTRWFQAMASVQRHAASSDEFHRHAAKAVVDPGGLEAGMILERADGGGWHIRSSYIANEPVGVAFEPELVKLACRRREPLVLEPGNHQPDGEHDAAIFVAPIFNEEMDVIAVLYGSRHKTEKNRRQHIRQLEALWFRLLAEAISAGYARSASEAKAARQRVLLEQAFPVDVVRRLSVRSATELPAEDKEVTLMFADLIDSSSFCEGESPETVVEFLSDVMDSMTTVIHRHGGVIVDYYGDGLIAMWNAPLDQNDHARLACEAGLEIQRQRTAINGRWEYRLGRANRFGIGIHTGKAIIGNSGSRHRFKYGPRGFAVNLANRIEKATRRLGQPILISDATRERLPCDASAFRLGEFKLWGIERPTGLHALFSLDASHAANSCCIAKYDDVVRLIENEDYVGAADKLDSCTGCALDELSLGFLKQQLDKLHRECQESSERVKPVFDLTK